MQGFRPPDLPAPSSVNHLRCRTLVAAAAAVVLLALPSLASAREPLVPGPTAKAAWTAKIVVRTVARSDPGGGQIVRALATRSQWSHGAEPAAGAGERVRPRLQRCGCGSSCPGGPTALSGWVNMTTSLAARRPGGSWSTPRRARPRVPQRQARSALPRRGRRARDDDARGLLRRRRAPEAAATPTSSSAPGCSR